jgi:hypothetical protein
MNGYDSSDRTGDLRDGQSLLPWCDCDAFCIGFYAGIAGAACGWRGLLSDLHGSRSCPWCGRATIMRIPPDRSGA